MKFWLITTGEPIPGDSPQPRLMRTGMLAEQLAREGEEVIWWNSTFHHSTKQNRANKNQKRLLENGVQLNLLYGRPYKTNISISRIKNHSEVARAFLKAAELESKPDLIVCAFPTIELSLAAVEYGKRNGVKVALDVRDLWPDLWLDVIPVGFNPFGKILLFPFFSKTRKAFENCDAILGTSKDYLDFGLRYARRAICKSDGIFPLGYSEQKPVRKFVDGIDSTKFTFLFIGSFGFTYDLTPFIEIARLYHQERRADIQFVFVGSGEREFEWKRLAQNLHNVIFTGRMSSDEIQAMMEVANVGLAAYVRGARQGLPNKLFEYLSAGLPVLSSLTGETKELLSLYQCGLTFDPQDLPTLKNLCDELYFNLENTKRMAHNAKRLYTEQFTTERINRDLVAHLRNLHQDMQVNP